MQFHLNYTPPKPGFELNHDHKIFMIGSCFSENIGTKLIEQRFKTHNNPNGNLFNPTSIHQCLETLSKSKPMEEKYFLNRDDIFYSYLHHSSIHDEYKNDLRKKIDKENQLATQFLKESNYLIITFGTAFVYRHLELQTVVANCHKQPASYFEKQMLTIENIVSSYSKLFKDLPAFNPNLRIIFTVSPVKYLKDGLIENNLSKSTLILAIKELIKLNPACSYFPAYELVTDDLRDYRFYKEDLAHPNQQAIDYVWEKFSDCFFSNSTQQLNREIKKLNTALNHRTLIANSAEAIKLNNFIIKQKEEIKKLDSSITF
jgi:hypothetical protein